MISICLRHRNSIYFFCWYNLNIKTLFFFRKKRRIFLSFCCQFNLLHCTKWVDFYCIVVAGIEFTFKKKNSLCYCFSFGSLIWFHLFVTYKLVIRIGAPIIDWVKAIMIESVSRGCKWTDWKGERYSITTITMKKLRAMDH